MAINKTINKRTNTHGAMRNCIEYVLRQDKTNELFTCVTGPYCHDEIDYELVYRTFLEEKKVWDKDSGRMYAHNVISWYKDEQITLEQALEFGKEFAENWFSGFQTLVAVHKDKDHIHCHLVTNSVSYEDGRKLHNTRKDLERMKQPDQYDYWSVKLVLLLYGHLHIIKIDGNTTHERRCFIWLQNQQIYMQGLNQMSKKKQKVSCLHLAFLLPVLSICFINRLSYREDFLLK